MRDILACVMRVCKYALGSVERDLEKSERQRIRKVAI